MKNLVKRGKFYYFRKLVDGKRKFQSLKTGEKNVAEARAKVLVKAAYDKRFEVIDGVRSKRLVATLGEIFTCYETAAIARGLASGSQYCNHLRNLIRKVHGPTFDVDAAPSTILTAALITSYADTEFLAAGKDVLKQERAKTTIRSTIINARSVFAKWTFNNAVYAKLTLPTLTAFKTIGTPWKMEKKVYHRPPQDLIDRTITAGRALRQKDPCLYACFLLSYDLALRAGESMALEWKWFEAHASEGEIIIHCDIFRRPNFRPKHNMDRSVPLNADTWRELKELRERPEWQNGDTATPHVLPGATATDRADLISREFAAWMRSLGWDAVTYPKAAHELRKLMGSEWFTRLDPQFAQEKLGHRNIATTCSYYARLANKPKALPRKQATAPKIVTKEEVDYLFG